MAKKKATKKAAKKATKKAAKKKTTKKAKKQSFLEVELRNPRVNLGGFFISKFDQDKR